MANIERHAILQSGFVSTNVTDLVKTSKERDQFVEFALAKDHVVKHNPFFYSAEITDLYQTASANRNAIKDFEFRERILKFGFKQFPKGYLLDWFNLQFNIGNLSELHMVFLVETFDYVAYGQPRRIESSQWISLLENTSISKKTNVVFKEYFKNRWLVANRENAAVVLSEMENLQTIDFFKAWSCNLDKSMDMLYSLFTIFGSRNVATNVANNTFE